MSTFPGYAEKGKQLWKMVPVVLFGSMTVPYCFSTYQEKLFWMKFKSADHIPLGSFILIIIDNLLT